MHGFQGNNIYEVKRKKRKIGGERRRACTYHQMVDREALVASHPCLIYMLPSIIYKGRYGSSANKHVIIQ